MPAVSDYSPLDRAYSEAVPYSAKPRKLEDPIIPINMLGQTVPEQDPSGGNIIQNVQAAIRRGAGNIQLVMTTSPEAAIGGRFKAYGHEVREELKEILLANDVKMSGIELPTAISNLSGFNRQQGAFSEETRERDIAEVRDAIRFAADVAGGGGVDILSWEFDRNFSDAKWNRDKSGKMIFEPAGGEKGVEKEVVQIVDTVTGRVSAIRKGEEVFLPFNPKTFKAADESKWNDQIAWDTDGLPKVEKWTWKDFEQVAKNTKDDEGNPLSPTDLFIRLQQNGQISTTLGYAKQYAGEALAIQEQMNRMKTNGIADDDPQMKQAQARFEGLRQTATGQLQQARQLQEQKGRLKDVEDYALVRATESYAELGIAAMHETHNRKLQGNPIHVGPELGWPTFFGSHPTEFVQLIKDSRKVMATQLEKDGLRPDDAMEEAKKHIKGTFDTSHLGMFFQHFRPHETDYDKRLKDFNKWFLDQVDFLAKENAKDDIIGGVQLVNSMSGAHGHLPPGQGIFPVVEAAKILAKKGNYSGYMTSEGHEEERIQAGRILLDTWKAFDPNIMSSVYGGGLVGGGASIRWRDVHQGYFGRPYSANFVVGDYSPSQEFRLWSEVPLE
ncbi:MAG: hypothetical protein AABY13_04235 [Nanoarchaeota archaeon]